MKIILATSSPYRIKAFKMLGITFEAEASNAEEKFAGRPNEPEALVKELARKKAEAVAKRQGEGIVIGFDSIGFFEGKILEKPCSRQEAFERLKMLSGKSFEFYTGMHFIDIAKGKASSDCSKTDVWMREISEEEIGNYLDSDKRFMTYALGFDPENSYSASFAGRIGGSYNNLIHGIPLEKVVEGLRGMGAIE
jgi:septum formation protein